MAGPLKKPRVFICYAKQDEAKALHLYNELCLAGVDAWLDKEKLVLGDNWELEIKKAVSESCAFLVLLRRGFNDIGFRQQEVRWARDACKLRPIGKGFIIPFLVEPCELPDWIGPFHAGRDLSSPTSLNDAILAIEKHCNVTLLQMKIERDLITEILDKVGLGLSPEEIGKRLGLPRTFVYSVLVVRCPWILQKHSRLENLRQKVFEIRDDRTNTGRALRYLLWLLGGDGVTLSDINRAFHQAMKGISIRGDFSNPTPRLLQDLCDKGLVVYIKQKRGGLYSLDKDVAKNLNSWLKRPKGARR